MDKQVSKILNLSRRLLLETTLTEKQIANMLYISESNFRYLYKKYFGMPPKRYIKHVKIKKAHTLIRLTDKSVSAIAYELSYINTSRFTEEFKREFRMTPSEYKNICRK